MKKILFMLVTLAFVLASCGYQPKVKPLEGNPTLSTFTEIAKDGKTILTGVAKAQSGHVVIPPAEYSEITADDAVITCKGKAGLSTLFKLNGEKIGDFEMVTPWEKNGKYYLGVRYFFKTFYFPEKNFVLTTQYSHLEPEVMFIKTEDNWLVLNYHGEILNKLPNEFTVLKNAKIPTQMWIAIWTKGKRPNCELYSINGEKYKTLSYKQWTKLFKNVVNQPLESSVFISETTEFDKF